MNSSTLRINDRVAIARSELVYRASRSGGPGGQHVNKSSTRVELTWDVAASPSLSEAHRRRLLKKLANRIDDRGVLRFVEGGSRSQRRNREAVTERLREVVGAALRLPKPRKRTRPPRAAKEARLREKKQRSEIKRRRRPVSPEE